MKRNTQKKAEKFWDRTANRYDNEEKKDQKINADIIERTKTYLKPSDLVLDLGCGTGTFSNEIATCVKQVDAIDFSSKMIELAKSKAEKQKIATVKYVQTTVFDQDLQLGSYDLVLSFYLLHLLDDPQVVIRRIQALLKPNGVFISVTPCMGEKPIQNIFFSVLSKIGLTPKITAFKRLDLERLITTENFEITESTLLPKTSNQYFIVTTLTDKTQYA